MSTVRSPVSYTHLDVYQRQPDSFNACSNTIGANERKYAGVLTGLFVQIQLNYVDWRHANEVNTRNTDAEYLYAELVTRNIPAVIMEPLLGGRLSRLNDHLMP